MKLKGLDITDKALSEKLTEENSYTDRFAIIHGNK